MKVTTDEIAQAISKWVETDLLPRSSLVQQGIITFLMLQGKPKLMSYIGMLNLLSDDKLFDVDELCTNINTALSKMGGSYTVPIIDYKLDRADVENIMELLKNERVK